MKDSKRDTADDIIETIAYVLFGGIAVAKIYFTGDLGLAVGFVVISVIWRLRNSGKKNSRRR
jgi:hypothetical protein